MAVRTQSSVVPGAHVPPVCMGCPAAFTREPQLPSLLCRHGVVPLQRHSVAALQSVVPAEQAPATRAEHEESLWCWHGVSPEHPHVAAQALVPSKKHTKSRILATGNRAVASQQTSRSAALLAGKTKITVPLDLASLFVSQEIALP